MERLVDIRSITWFLELQQVKALNLEPSYQRRSVWSIRERQYFLDTILRDRPSPQIFIHKVIDKRGHSTYHVVDGKQRLETIIMFKNNEIRIGRKFGNSDIDNKKFEELDVAQREQFWNYKIVIEYIDVLDNINDVFDRLNRFSKNLKPQELRHAKYDGWFIKEVEHEANDGFWEHVKISTKAKVRRMHDVQFISELSMIIIEQKISGFNQEHIDDIYAEYEDIEKNESSFDRDLYFQEKARIKNYIRKMLDVDEDITEWLKKLTNLYTLWALVYLYDNHLPNPKKLVSRYKIFMESVDSMTEDTKLQKLSDHEKVAYSYYANSRGPSGDNAPRKARLNQLAQAILNEDSKLNS